MIVEDVLPHKCFATQLYRVWWNKRYYAELFGSKPNMKKRIEFIRRGDNAFMGYRDKKKRIKRASTNLESYG